MFFSQKNHFVSIFVVFTMFSSCMAITFVVPDLVASKEVKRDGDLSASGPMHRVNVARFFGEKDAGFCLCSWNDSQFLADGIDGLRNLYSEFMNRDRLRVGDDGGVVSISLFDDYVRVNELLQKFVHELKFNEDIPLGDKKVFAAIVLAMQILHYKKEHPEEIVNVLGFGVHGAQVAHLASQFLERSSRILDPLTIAQLVFVGLQVCRYLYNRVQHDIEVCRAGVVSKNKDLIFLAKKIFKDFLSTDFFSNVSTKIDLMVTVGATFVDDSALPLLSTVGHYCNFFSYLDISKTLGRNTVRLKSDNWKSYSAISNIEVKTQKPSIFCASTLKYCSPSHEKLLESPLLLGALRYFLSFPVAFVEKVKHKPFSRVELRSIVDSREEYEFFEFDPKEGGERVRNGCTFLFCCRCCYRD